MFLNAAAIDYLTLATWSLPVYETMQRIMENTAIGPLGEARRMQYRGVTTGGVFVGQGEIQGRAHYLFQASGMDAELVAVEMAYLPAKCTRIDLQVTCALPRGYDAAKVATVLRGWSGPGKPRGVTLVQNGDGLDTVYIGSRGSRRYIRLYVKPDESGRPWLRFEVEYKRELAADVWQEIRVLDEPHETMRAYLLHEMLSVPLLDGLVGDMMRVLDGEADAPRPERRASEGRTLAWLRDQVGPAVLRSMYDHDEGVAIRSLVRAWAAEADMVDDTIDSLD